MSVVDPSFEKVKTIVDNAQQLRWVRLSSLVLVLWDHIICLDKEIELVWVCSRRLLWLMLIPYQKRPWTRFTTLYMIIRYGGGFVGAGFYVLGYIYPNPSNAFCLVWVMYEGYSGCFGTATFQFVLAARVWGLYGNSKRMLYVLGVALSTSLAGMLTVWVIHTPFALSHTAGVGNIDFYVCHETRAAPHIWLFWVSPLAYDILVFFLAIYKGYRMYRANLGSRMSLMVVVVRDSVVYFFAISIAELTIMLMWLMSGGAGVIMKAPIMFAAVMPLVMCCHLMLNLRESSVKQSNITTTHGVELSEWNSHLRERPLDHGLDSMGLPRLSEITRVNNDG